MSKNGEWKPVGTIWRREQKASSSGFAWIIGGSIIGMLLAIATS
jgi:hypothetical protein